MHKFLCSRPDRESDESAFSACIGSGSNKQATMRCIILVCKAPDGRKYASRAKQPCNFFFQALITWALYIYKLYHYTYINFIHCILLCSIVQADNSIT